MYVSTGLKPTTGLLGILPRLSHFLLNVLHFSYANQGEPLGKLTERLRSDLVEQLGTLNIAIERVSHVQTWYWS